MKLNIQTALIANLMLLAVQILVPAFVPMTEPQQTAIAAFCQAAGAALGISSLYRNPDGSAAGTPYEKK